MASQEKCSNSLFSKIIRKELPAIILYQDESVTVIKDKFPQAPVHFLVIPNREIVNLQEVEEKDIPLLGRMLLIASEQAKKLGLEGSGYRVIINNGANAGQEIPHLHIHVLGGERIGPMRPIK